MLRTPGGRNGARPRSCNRRAAIGHLFSPAPAATTQSNASLSANPQTRTLTFRWRTDADDQPNDDDVG